MHIRPRAPFAQLFIRPACALGLAAAMLLPAHLRAAEEICASYFRNSFVQWGFTPGKVRYDKITHLLYFGPGLKSDGTTDASASDPVLAEVRQLCRQNHVKLIGVVFANPRTQFQPIISDPAKRAVAVQSIAKWCREAWLDGIDIDFEHPANQTDAAQLGQFLTELRAALGDRPLLCAAVAPVLGVSSIPPAVVNESLDFLNIMSYDHGGEHATLAAAVSDMDFHRNQGILPSKLVLGIPFYGVHVTNRDARGYSYLLGAFDPNPAPDVNTLGGYYFNGRDLVRTKGRLGFEKGGGVFDWVIDQDVSDSRSLLTAMEEGAASGEAVLDGFEAPLFGNPADGYTLTGVTLSPTLRRSAGSYGARAVLSFTGAPWCEASLASPAVPAFSFPTGAAVRLDAFLEGSTPGALYFTFTDSQGRRARGVSYVLYGSGWKSVWIPRSSFELLDGGFDFDAITGWRIAIQGGNGSTAVTPFTRTVVLDNLAIFSPGAARPQRMDNDADFDGVPDRNIASRSVVWIDRFNHPAPTTPGAIYSFTGTAGAVWKWAASANGGSERALEGTLSYDGSRFQIGWIESPTLPPFATGPDSVFHAAVNVIQPMPNATLYIDFFDDTGARRRFWDYNLLKTTGRKVLNLRLGSPNDGTNNLARLARWRIGFEGTGVDTAAFTGKIQLARLAWGRLPAGSTAATYEGDRDGDGLSDIVEDRNLDGILGPGETDATLADTDGDGMSDGGEAIAGTDPRDPASRLELGVAPAGGGVELRWTAVPARAYQIESSADLKTWSVAQPWFTPAPGPAVWPAPASAPSQFFRLRVK